MVDQDEFLIQELSEKVGVSHRTIRYYTQEGLLPEPVSRGKYVYYSQEHVDRLRLILQLKETYLPLKEIRQLLASLSWPEVRDLLERKTQPGPPPPAEPRPPARGLYESAGAEPSRSVAEPGSALDYINQLLRSGPREGVSEPAQTVRMRPSGPAPSTPGANAAPPESWRRYTLAPGVELHIKEPTSAGDRQRLEELTQFARNLFSKDSS
jgi:DNA-binding transcriptional MerR regulator